MTSFASIRTTVPELVRPAARLLALGLLAACGGGGDGITVNANVAGVRFVNQPANVTVGQPFSVSVELITSGGDRATSATNVVTLTASGATLNGSTAVAAVAGLATFTGLTMTSGGTGVQLQASAAGFSSSSVAFTSTDPCGPIALSVPGNANGTINDTSCLLSGLRVALYRFTSTGSGANTFNVDAAFPARVEVTTVPPGDNVSFINSQSAQVNGEWLLPAGTYQFRVSARSGNGTYSITATNPAGNTGCTVRAFVVSGNYTQALANSDCQFSDMSYYDVFYIYSTRACTVTLRSTAFDTYLIFADAQSGSTLAEDDDNGGGPMGTDSQLSRPACNAAGNPLAIVANSFGPTEVGSYTLAVQLAGGGADVVTEAPIVLEMPAVSPNFAPKLASKRDKRRN
jgi:hypothetical protein